MWPTQIQIAVFYKYAFKWILIYKKVQVNQKYNSSSNNNWFFLIQFKENCHSKSIISMKKRFLGIYLVSGERLMNCEIQVENVMS